MPEKEKPSLESLAHYGAKGMRWGTKKAYADRVVKSTEHLDSVAKGKGSGLYNLRVAAATTNGDFWRGGGSFKGAARVKSKRQKEHATRVLKGEETIKDTLKRIHGTTLAVIAKGGMDKNRKK